MKKIVLILITLILATGMVFAADSSTSTVKITGTVTPHKPDGGFGDGGLSIVGYVVENNNPTPGEVAAYNKGDDNTALVEDTTEGQKTSISVDILHEDNTNTTESLTLVFGAVCDMSPTADKTASVNVSVTAGEWKLKKDDTTFEPVKSLFLNADTKPNTKETSKTYDDIVKDATLSWGAGQDGRISVTATPGANSNQEVVFIGYTNITWGRSQVEGAPAVTAGDYEADITITFDAT